jgi:hypothetical protein
MKPARAVSSSLFGRCGACKRTNCGHRSAPPEPKSTVEEYMKKNLKKGKKLGKTKTLAGKPFGPIDS